MKKIRKEMKIENEKLKADYGFSSWITAHSSYLF
jgi:hypothetical protein